MVKSVSRTLSLSIVILIVFLVSALQVTFAQSNATFKIGVLDNIDAPLTNGARLAVEAVNQAGGVRGADGTMFDLDLTIISISADTNVTQAIANLDGSGVKNFCITASLSMPRMPSRTDMGILSRAGECHTEYRENREKH